MIAKTKRIKKTRHFKNLFFTILILFIFLGFIGFLFFSNLRMNQKRRELTEQIEKIEKEIQILEEKNEQLKQGILEAETDPYWEARLYEQGFKKPGEEAVVIIPLEQEEVTETKEKNFLESFWEKIGF